MTVCTCGIAPGEANAPRGDMHASDCPLRTPSITTTKVTVTFSREEIENTNDDVSYLMQDYSDVADAAERAKYKAQDAERLAAYHKGDWHFVGIRAKATIRIDYYNGGQLNSTYFHELVSPGLYGIESDSDENYFAEVFEEECASLKSDLQAMAYTVFKE